MIISKVKANNICKLPGGNKDDTTSRRVSDSVMEQMDNNGAGGMTQIETGPGDTLESIAKGNLGGTGQKVDKGNVLFEQSRIIQQNYKELKANMDDPNGDPKDFKNFKGKELPQGMKINLTTNHTQHSNTPTFDMNSQDDDRIQGASPSMTKCSDVDMLSQMNSKYGNDYFAGAGSISDTSYALEMFGVALPNDAKVGVSQYLNKKKKAS